ncbi:FG-GAP repeat domain-containing protein [Thalassovita sp.]|uniref:FG-GAP repeat domain-containing protein n=1 Tax=Thalassovita sp. TaxID=1979401 RepID=UPI003B5CEDD0
MLRSLRMLVWAGLMALPGSFAQAQIVSAQFIQPVDRYHHDILGDTPEWGGMRMHLANGRAITVTLPQSKIFEDITPRLVDVDGDGDPEVIAVETTDTLGARLTIWDETGVIAATPNIGRRNRWLAPIGAADLDGDGKVEIAYIDRPHLARLLRVWRFEQGQLKLVAEKDGLTNHRIGDAEIFSGLRDCGDGPQMITVNSNWSRLMASVLTGGNIRTQDIGPYHGPASLTAALACR